jgi:prepilin peptidase CpaA
MTTWDLLMCLPMLGLLIVAAAMDWRSRRIPNWLTLGLLTSGLAQSLAWHGAVTPMQSLLGALAGFGLLLVLFVLGAVGGGDVKLLAGVGAWLGPQGVLQVFTTAAVVGLIIVLVQSVWQGRMRILLRNSAVVALNLVQIEQLGAEHVISSGQSARSVEKPLPYAVPVLAAALVVLLAQWH